MSELANLLVKSLRADAHRHEQADFANVGLEFDSVEEFRSHNPDLPWSRNEAIAHTFWDAWIDQVRHGFGQNFYEGVPAGAWPTLAKEIAGSLESGVPISNPIILRHFDLSAR